MKQTERSGALIIGAIVTLAAALIPVSALADDGFLGAVGHGVVPLENDHIAMIGERVDVDIRGGQAWVTCVFTFTNTGPAADVLMGFPEAWSRWPDITPDRPSTTTLEDFKAFVDGEEYRVECRRQVVATATANPTLSPSDRRRRRLPANTSTPRASAASTSAPVGSSLGRYAGWYTFSVPFADDQTRVVNNTYRGVLGGTSDGTQIFDYVLETGASWRGSIGHAEVVVRWDAMSSLLAAQSSLNRRAMAPESASSGGAGLIGTRAPTIM